MSDKKEVRIMLDFLCGPIVMSDRNTGELYTSVDFIDNDKLLTEWNAECGDLFDSFYEFDSHDVACWFDVEGFKANRQRLIDLVDNIRNRLDELNDGSYVVIDDEGDYLKTLHVDD